MKRATTSLRFLPALLAVLISVSSAGCGSDEQEVEALAERFAVMESRAIDLRERRFELADAIRFATDTLLGSADSIVKGRLRERLTTLEGEKQEVLAKSLSLADSLRSRLDSLMRNDLLTDERKQLFREKLEDALKKRGHATEGG